MTFKPSRRTVLIAALLASAAAVTPVAAQTYPERPITMIVPFGPGGSTDLIARIVIAKAEAALGQPIVIENKPGAGTMIGLNELVGAEPDGYTIGMTTSSAALQPIYGAARYDYVDELTPIAQFAQTAPILAVQASSDWQTLEDLLADAKANPGAIKYGITGVGNSSHLGPAQVALEAGVEMPHVVFDGGATLMTALLGGHVSAAAGSPVDYKEQIAAGELRGLVLFAEERSDDALIGQIPTALELGYTAEITSWTAVSGPKGMAPEVVAKLEGAFAEAMADEEVLAAIRELGSDPVYLDAEALGERMRNAREGWTAIVTDTGILDLVKSQTN
ncbi:Tripartite-type tricarboxylate transporter, receptor component TctC [Devosia enhydra]|uniref:Tripartite-type tricarboxylate transporter, receptor component TctC n=1 Tax=Devosia enhydra TaxID=665118 RepID=A0A1K2I2G6_9HYPH|nr:tripartite tricarboxylate transporter substrate binding protein [Devosia enhydra]SFZ85948.1 Tripartite-type tricarboxylate transporter, receptor component TctC [Devosia enhydra]